MNFKVKLKKHSPTILVLTGIGGVIAGTVLACKKTIKMTEIKEETKYKIEEANAKLSAVNPEDENYTEKENRKEIAKIYCKAALNTTKNYALPVAIGGTGIAMILCGHKILKKRYAMISAAYLSLNASFEAYRERVREKVGEKEEYNIYHNVETIEEQVEGKKKKLKKNVIKDASMYDIVFSPNTSATCHGDYHYDSQADTNPRDPFSGWSGHDILRVKALRNDLETILTSKATKIGKKPVVKLNTVRERLDVDLVEEGEIVGWEYDPSNENIDSHIMFDLYETVDFKGSPALGISLNVDGIILDILKNA